MNFPPEDNHKGSDKETRSKETDSQITVKGVMSENQISHTGDSSRAKAAYPGVGVKWILTAVAFFILTLLSSYQVFFAEQTVIYDIHEVEFKDPEVGLEGPFDRPTIVHFIDPGCACNRFSLPHIADIERTYPDVLFQRVYSDNRKKKDLQIDIPQSLVESVPASPAVMIFDQQGKVAYFGPYTDDVFCGEGNDFVEKMLKILGMGYNPEWVNLFGFGCFCPWRSNTLEAPILQQSAQEIQQAAAAAQ